MNSLQYAAKIAEVKTALQGAAQAAIELGRYSESRNFILLLETFEQTTLSTTTLNDQEIRMVEERRPIDAIKNYRNRTGVALKDAKDVVEAYRARENK